MFSIGALVQREAARKPSMSVVAVQVLSSPSSLVQVQEAKGRLAGRLSQFAACKLAALFAFRLLGHLRNCPKKWPPEWIFFLAPRQKGLWTLFFCVS